MRSRGKIKCLLRRAGTLVGLVGCIAIFGANMSCADAWLCAGFETLDAVLFDPSYPYYYDDGCYYQWSDHEADDPDDAVPAEAEKDDDDAIHLTGAGNDRLLRVASYEYAAHQDTDEGPYLFSPDPDGEISGEKICCLTTIDDLQIQGNCFRAGRVCFLEYERDESASVPEGETVYTPVLTTCEFLDGLGPFLVLEDAPACGEESGVACQEY